jgi:hypothetical protein
MNHADFLPSQTWKIIGTTALLILSGMIAWQQHAALASAQSTYLTKQAQVASMQADARQLGWLRTAPQRATDRRLPHEQLAAEIEEACKRASIPAGALVSIWPESPKRLAHSDYQELTTRLGLEQVSLQQIVAFAYHLQSIDSSLNLAEIRLTSQKGEDTSWDVELCISYLLFAPGAGRMGA